MGTMATCFPKNNPNPLAPPWMFPSEALSETPKGYRDEYHLFTVTKALTLGQITTVDLLIDTAGQCNYYWTGLGVFLYAGAGTPAVRLRDSDGYMMFNTRAALANGSPFGFRDMVTPMAVPHRMIPGAKLSLDFQETGGVAGVTVLLMFHGFKRWIQDPALDGRGGSFGV
jgi:hypothetical protein